MVFRRRGGKRRYIARKKNTKRELKRTTVKDMAQDYEVKKLKRQVAGLSQSVKGYIIYTSTASTFQEIPSNLARLSNTSLLWAVPNARALNEIAVGDDYNNRTGDFVTLKSFSVRYQIHAAINMDGAVNGPAVNVRVMLVCSFRPDGQPGVSGNSNVPSFDSLFAIPPGTTLTRASLMAPLTLEQTGMHKVYYDRIHTVLPNLNNPFNNVAFPSIKGRIFVRPTKKNSVTTYNDPNLGISNISKNMWYLLVFSDNQSGGNATPAYIQYYSVTRYEQ